MRNSVQWVNVPPGASGSSSTSTSSAARPGTPDHASGGDFPAPAQVNCLGRRAPSRNAGLESRIVAAEGARILAFFPPPHPAIAATRRVPTAAALSALALTAPVAFHAFKGEARDLCAGEQDRGAAG